MRYLYYEPSNFILYLAGNWHRNKKKRILENFGLKIPKEKNPLIIVIILL